MRRAARVEAIVLCLAEFHSRANHIFRLPGSSSAPHFCEYHRYQAMATQVVPRNRTRRVLQIPQSTVRALSLRRPGERLGREIVRMYRLENLRGGSQRVRCRDDPYKAAARAISELAIARMRE